MNNDNRMGEPGGVSMPSAQNSIQAYRGENVSEPTQMQRLHERVMANTESLSALSKTLTDLRNRLGGVPAPSLPGSAPVAPGMPQTQQVVGIISKINDSLNQGEVALNQIDDVIRSLRKIV